LAKGKVLQCKVRAGAEGGTQGSKEAQDQGNHRAIMHDGGFLAASSVPRHRHRRQTDGADDLPGEAQAGYSHQEVRWVESELRNWLTSAS